jgi:hypothetical protein
VEERRRLNGGEAARGRGAERTLLQRGNAAGGSVVVSIRVVPWNASVIADTSNNITAGVKVRSHRASRLRRGPAEPPPGPARAPQSNAGRSHPPAARRVQEVFKVQSDSEWPRIFQNRMALKGYSTIVRWGVDGEPVLDLYAGSPRAFFSDFINNDANEISECFDDLFSGIDGGACSYFDFIVGCVTLRVPACPPPLGRRH